MKAYVFLEPNRAELMELDKPVPREDEVLIKVKACGFCGTDIHTYRGEHITTYPIVPGHEFSGEVTAVGSSVKNLKSGDLVVGDPNIFCEGCHYCKQNKQIHCEHIEVVGNTRNGAFAEYVTLPARCVFVVPEGADMVAMAMAEPLACVINAHNKAAIPIGGKVLILGAGTIGLLHMMIAKHRGASSVTMVDVKPGQLEIAKQLGADHVLQSDESLSERLKALAPYGYDFIIEATGVPKVAEYGIPFLANAGTFITFGAYPINSRLQVDPQQIYVRDLKIIGSYALQKTMPQAISMIQENVIDLQPLVGRTIALEEMPEVFQLFREGKTINKTIVIF